ncbi:hypothetical protein EC973_002708 [Apophysomyces ossiformis]|uniref:Inhibitor I9 domain-containing protein n=1 Tax=Apophysomyces ossiformis TaxID=679940 RepID=A0A8H7EME0_9FUNG|nr:hypothetical protein EC973_002708 [Apophysomyces ossiformis]
MTVHAAEPGYVDYIMALSEPATPEKFKQAREDVEKVGGKVTYEITIGLKALTISLPEGLIQSFDNKDYVDFIEEDKIVHFYGNE